MRTGVSFLVTVILRKNGLKASAPEDLRYLTAFAKKKLDQVIVTANRNPGRERSTPFTLHPPSDPRTDGSLFITRRPVHSRSVFLQIDLISGIHILQRLWNHCGKADKANVCVGRRQRFSSWHSRSQSEMRKGLPWRHLVPLNVFRRSQKMNV